MQNRLARMQERSWMIHKCFGMIPERIGMIRNWFGMIPEGLPMIRDWFGMIQNRFGMIGSGSRDPKLLRHARDPREPPHEHQNRLRSLSTSIPAPYAVCGSAAR